MLLDLPSGQVVVKSVEDAIVNLIPTVNERPNFESPTSEERRIGARLHALIIGISGYERHPLRGAAAAADAMYQFLRTKLDVPEHQIKNLRDGEATRDAIIRELKAMRTRQAIGRNDPLLLYFAGHESSLPSPQQAWGWYNQGRDVSVLVPYDGLLNDQDQCTCPIPDRTVATLLLDLSKEKGDNITLICDCCFSDSSNSGVPNLTDSSRSELGLQPEELVPIHPVLDRDVWYAQWSIRTWVFVNPGFILEIGGEAENSHIFLRGCRAGEVLYEDSGRGDEPHFGGEFTRTLLNVLRDVSVDKATYKEVLRRIEGVSSLKPQYEGHVRDRLLFSILERDRIVYQLSRDEGRYTLGAGTAQCVTEGAQFAIYSSPVFSVGEIPLARMTAKNVGSFGAEVVFTPSSPVSALAFSDTSPYFAFQTRTGKSTGLRLHAALSENVKSVMSALAKHRVCSGAESPGILLTNEAEANLSTYATFEGRIEYAIHDSLIRKHGLTTLLETTLPTTECTYPVLVAASKFFWHLHRTPTSKQELATEGVQIVMRRLERARHTSGWIDYWMESGDNLVHSGVVDIQVDGKVPYGLAVENGTGKSLYVSAFYFDCSNLSIAEYYSARVGEPIPAGGRLLIGDGTAKGGRPFSFYLPPSQAFDVGLVKFFISTEYVDLSWVAQDSPFETGSSVRRSTIQVPARPADGSEEGAGWSTMLVTVLQRQPTPGRGERQND